MALVDSGGRAIGKMSKERRRALRSHDITHGLQNVGARNAAVSKLEATRVIGWSAAIAGVEAAVESGRQRVEQTAQSILARAFRGELNGLDDSGFQDAD